LFNDLGPLDQKQLLKSIIQSKVVDRLSRRAIREIVNSDSNLKGLWDYSSQIFPDLKNHFTVPVESDEIEDRIRLLIVYETLFVRNEIDNLLNDEDHCSFADVGDSDGSVQMLLNKEAYDDRLSTVGINLQQGAVEKIRQQGLDAVCADALALGDMGQRYDIISLFETLEHLPDPIGFLKGIKPAVTHRLVVSVPYIRKSRVGLAYLSKKWPADKTPTIENTHIFELSTNDWVKIFHHTGWEICRQEKLLMYHPYRLSRIVIQPYWRHISFEGFWFVALCKNSEFSDRYSVE